MGEASQKSKSKTLKITPEKKKSQELIELSESSSDHKRHIARGDAPSWNKSYQSKSQNLS
jgi:hypothetical protein